MLYKVQDTGQCVIYEQSRLHKCVPPVLAKNFDFTTFRRICILSGCDYLPGGLPGVGLKKAVLFFAKMTQLTTRKDLDHLLAKIPAALAMSNLQVTPAFVEDFIRAENTFLYQTVFDPM